MLCRFLVNLTQFVAPDYMNKLVGLEFLLIGAARTEGLANAVSFTYVMLMQIHIILTWSWSWFAPS
jgi:hypothetical protein